MKHLCPTPAFCRRVSVLATLVLMLVSAQSGLPAPGQQSHSLDRESGRTMLATIKEDIRKNYYDPKFHGIDLDTRFREADEKIKQANSMGEILGIIAEVLLEFNDSHTMFEPPSITARIEHGWQMQMIGDKCYIVAVQPGSDAEAKGLRPGDRVVALEGYRFDRSNLWKLQYTLYLLSPRPSLRVVVEQRDGKQHEYTIAAKVYQGKSIIDLRIGVASDRMTLIREAQTEARLHAHRYYEVGDDYFIWKMPEFNLDNSHIDEMMDKVRKRKALILDLRGNTGGSEETLLHLLGCFFDHDVKVGELKRRKESKPLVAKTNHDRLFKGEVVVLVDSDSASAAELLARVMQLEKRGRVIGDRTAGAVMRSREYEHHIGITLLLYYGASVTDADIEMSDGHSLERFGVTPDETQLPTPADLAALRDPVLAHAASLVGLSISPEKAGMLFPVQWRK